MTLSECSNILKGMVTDTPAPEFVQPDPLAPYNLVQTPVVAVPTQVPIGYQVPAGSLRRWTTRYAATSALFSLLMMGLLGFATSIIRDGSEAARWIPGILAVVFFAGTPFAMVAALVTAHVLVSIPGWHRNPRALSATFGVAATLLGSAPVLLYVANRNDWPYGIAIVVLNALAAVFVSHRMGPAPVRPPGW